MLRLTAFWPLVALGTVLNFLEAAPKAMATEGVSECRLLNALPARSIGPANMGGRITDVAVVENNPKAMYVAAATGGLWKTEDSGHTWKPVFDGQSTLCLGSVAVSPSHPNVVWVGTGEANPRNSVSWGNGVYKSTDGGLTWRCMGLKETHHVGRIVIHPTKPEVVFVAGLGHLWGPNPERGLYRTLDGGHTWQKVLFSDDHTGFIDVAQDWQNPDILYAATYRVRRDGFAGGNPKIQWGPGTGLFRSADGGTTWTKMTRGLPDRPLGRCGLAVYRKDPRIVYAVIQTDKTAITVRGQSARENTEAATGGLFRSEDRGQTWKKVNDLCPRPFYYGQVRIDPNNDRRIYVLGVSFHISNDGGKTFPLALASRGAHPDHHALWIDPKNSKNLVLGNDGGLYFSSDQAKSWEAVRNLPLGQFYAAAVDMRRPYRVYGGLQDNGSWGGPSATFLSDGITPADWRRVGGSDGFQCQVDPTNPDLVYIESQYGNPIRLDLKNNRSKRLRPSAPQGQPAYRYNWNAPLFLSPHQPQTLYFGGNHLFRSNNRGDTWEVISPDLTRGQPGPNTYSGHTITAIAESPLKAGLLYVGTDDGRLHLSQDGGKKWQDLSDRIPGISTQRWITRVECSHFHQGTAYVTIDRHRNDDRRPYIFKTTDFGITWAALAADLPEEGPVHVLRGSFRNPDLLFVGTEFGLLASLDAGRHWHRFQNGMPPAVTVHDLVLHPRERELVIATHGRSLYVLDVAPLEELTAKVRAKDLYLCDIKPALVFTPRKSEKPPGPRTFTAPNPPFGATISYFLKTAPISPVLVAINDAKGRTLASLPGTREAGLNQVVWNLRSGNSKDVLVPPGPYQVTVRSGGLSATKTLRVEAPGK